MPTAERDERLETLAAWFRGFAEFAPSELYRRLSADVARAPDVLDVLVDAAPVQQFPMLLFAAVHARVLREGTAYPADGPAFLDYWHAHAPELLPVLRTRTTQTNEVGRCAYLRPCIAAAADGRPLALIEVGASAGLNLNLDRYAYDLGGLTAGAADAPVTITTELRGAAPPLALPPIAWRVGIDLAPAPDPAWLRACVFADQPQRLARLDAALAVAAEHPVRLVEGDAVALLPQILAAVPAGLQPVVFHTAVTVYFDQAQRLALDEFADTVTHIRAEQGHADAGFLLEVDGREVGSAHPHGTWLRWGGA